MNPQKYTLDFTNVKSASGTGFDAANTITFTTVDPEKEPVSLSSATKASGGALTNGITNVKNDENFILNFDKIDTT